MMVNLVKNTMVKWTATAVSQMSNEDQRTIQSLIDGMILKHQAKQLAQVNG